MSIHNNTYHRFYHVQLPSMFLLSQDFLKKKQIFFHQISDKADKCPSCGCPVETQKSEREKKNKSNKKAKKSFLTNKKQSFNLITTYNFNYSIISHSLNFIVE